MNIKKIVFIFSVFLLSACFYKAVSKDIFPEELHFVCSKEVCGSDFDKKLFEADNKYVFVKKWFFNDHDWQYDVNSYAHKMYFISENFRLNFLPEVGLAVLNYKKDDGSWIQVSTKSDDVGMLFEFVLEQ